MSERDKHRSEVADGLPSNKKTASRGIYSLTFRIIAYVFAILILTMVFASAALIVFYSLGWFEDKALPFRPTQLIIFLLLISVIIGCALSIVFYRFTFKEFDKFMTAMNRVAKGDFDVYLSENKNNYMRDLNNCFNAMVRSLKSIETLKTDFVSDFSHEFKTPIASILGFARLLKSGNLTEEEKSDYVSIIISESTRLTQLAKNTLSISKLENHETVYPKKDFLVDEQVRKCLLLFQSETESKNINLSFSGEEVHYTGSEDLTQQLWINLISNAVKFTPQGGMIDIAVSENAGKITVRVTDSGCGMSEAVKKNIFNKFYQGDNSHSTPGNGLGLSIVKKILEIIGGEIAVESKPDMGTTMTVTLN